MFKYIYHGLFPGDWPVVKSYNGFMLAPFCEMATNIAHLLATFYSYILMPIITMDFKSPPTVAPLNGIRILYPWKVSTNKQNGKMAKTWLSYPPIWVF